MNEITKHKISLKMKNKKKNGNTQKTHKRGSKKSTKK